MARAVASLALLLTALLAGCADGSPSGGEEPTPEAFDEVEVTDTTGAIRGIVYDETITPLQGVLVMLASGANKTTDAEGAFVFSGLEPGDYFVTATKQGYVAIQQSVKVEAGQNPPITKIQLKIDPGALKPFYQEYIFDGFIQCSGTFVAVSFAACSFINIAAPVTDDRFGVTYVMEQTPSWIQTEMVWDSTQAAGGEMTVQYSWGCDTNGGFLCDYGIGGPSPLVLMANATAIAEINHGDYDGTDLFIRSFNQGLRETDVGPGGGLGLTVNQKFTYFTHIFYGYEPTPGWRFGDNTPVPQPPT